MSNGFQFTPFGVFPLGASVPAMEPEAIAPGGAAVVEAVHQQAQQQPEAARLLGAAKRLATQPLDPGRPLTGRELMTQAKARIRAIDALLRGVPKLQAERASLARLVQAAAPQKTAKAKDIQ